ncbi:MAG: hypothetical protein GY765_18445, partial [bacterium]|nr:hypothetical protein [bacterium]
RIFKSLDTEPRIAGGSGVKLLFALASVVFHIVWVYFFYNTAFSIKNHSPKETIQLVTLSAKKIILPPVPAEKKQIKSRPVLSADSPSVRVKQSAPVPPKQPEPESEAGPTITAKPLHQVPDETLRVPREIKKVNPETFKKSFDARAYLLRETPEAILAKHTKKQAPKKETRHPKSAGGVYVGADDIVVDQAGKAYFQGKGFDISPWARNVIAKINSHWFIFPNVYIANGSVVGVAITFTRDGGVTRVQIKRPSLSQPMDQSVLNAVNLSAPFPRLPEAFPHDRLEVFLLFNYYEEK